MTRRAVALSLLLVTAACNDAGQEPGEAALAQLHQLFDEVWEERQRSSALLRVREGLPIEHLDDVSVEGALARIEAARRLLARLDAIDLAAVDHGQWVNAQVLRWDLETAIEGERWLWHEGFLTPYLSPLPGLRQVFQAIPVDTREGRAQYLSLLDQVPAFVEQLEERARGQAERGIYVWRPNLETVVALVRAHVGSAEAGPFAVPTARLEGVAPEEVRGFMSEIDVRLDADIHPALESLVAFLEGEDYAPHTPPGVGASQHPDGAEWYRYAVRRSVTMDVTPEEVHQIGLEMVHEMEAAMAAIRDEVGFEGTREEFHEMLRTDPRFFPASPEEVRDRILAAARDMEMVVDDYFTGRPEAPYDTRRLDLDLEASQTYGVYQPPTAERPEGVYRFNGSRLNERSWLNLRAVSLHELVPGHHFHIARQVENTMLPDFRRQTWHGAFTEGWGSYSSFLGLEAGIFDEDPYSRYGLYVLEIFLATRLVVDTGMNYLGWTLDEGRAYMREHTLESETQIATESLRYSADMPAQALAYQMGKRQFQQLRVRAAEALGADFDVRGFHEAVLEHGSLPMRVLDEHVGWWIEQQG